MGTKAKGVLSPAQSRFLGGVGQSPLCSQYPQTKEFIIESYLNSEQDGERPTDIDENARKMVDFAIATSEKAAEMDIEADPYDIVDATPSPFNNGEFIDVEDDDDDAE